MPPKHKHPRRRPGSEQHEPDDVFVAKVFEFSTWARKNSQSLILGTVALAVLLAGGLYFRDYRGTLNDQAIAELEVVQQAVAIGEVDPAKALLLQYLERFESTVYAHEARLLLGQIYLRNQETTQAIELLQPANGFLSSPLGPQLGSLLAKAYEQADRWQDADAQYMRVADAAELGFQRREALEDAARVRERLGDYAGAAELYGQILDELDVGNPNRPLYDMRLVEAAHRSRS